MVLENLSKEIQFQSFRCQVCIVTGQVKHKMLENFEGYESRAGSVIERVRSQQICISCVLDITKHSFKHFGMTF